MGNTPSQNAAGQPTPATAQRDASPSVAASPATPQRLPSHRDRHHRGISPGPISPPGLGGHPGGSYSNLRPGSPRRRKSLELPDLNSRLSLTSAHPSLTPGSTTLTPSTASNQDASSSRVTAAPPSAMPIPGARGVRRWGSSRDRSGKKMTPERPPPPPATQEVVSAPPDRTTHNPYFPAVNQIQETHQQQKNNVPPITPGLPNYELSPKSAVQHTEDVDGAGGSDRLSVNQVASGRQPSPARPAPAIVTKAPQYHDHQSSAKSGVSSQPSTASTTTDDPPPPSVQLPISSPSIRPQQQDVIVSHLPKGSSPGIEVPEEANGRSQRALGPVAGEQPRSREEIGTVDGLVPTLVSWNGGGKDVYVTGTFAEHGWKTRMKLEKSTHDFSLLLNLPPGTHRVKFIVDGHWRCSNDLQTATDGDGNLVNWLEVEVPRTGDADEDWAVAQWAQKAYAAEVDDDDPSIWTSEIPPALIHFQELEERGITTPPDEVPPKELHAFHEHQKQILSLLPLPPTLPRHLEKVILNTTPKELDSTVGGAAGDDNSILPVPNHVVLNHLTASAIKNGTLAVGTTTRYKRKYISTIYFKPVGDL